MALLWLFVNAPGRAENIPVIEVTQKHYYFGKMQALIGKNELRLVNLGSFKFILLSRAPKWDVVVYRLDDKIMFRQSYDSFLTKGVVPEMISMSRHEFPIQSSKCKPHVDNGVSVMRFANHYYDFAFIPGSEINPKIEKIIYATYQTPTDGGFPLRFVQLIHKEHLLDAPTAAAGKEEPEYVLTTQKVRKTTAAKSGFDYPANLKQASSMQEVVSAKKDRANSDAVFRDLMQGK